MGFFKVIYPVIALFLAVACSMGEFDIPVQVDPPKEVVAKFNSAFPGADSVKWYSFREYFYAEFINNSVKSYFPSQVPSRAWFSEDADCLYIQLGLFSAECPAFIDDKVASLQGDGFDSYYVKYEMRDDSKYYVLYVLPSGTIDFSQSWSGCYIDYSSAGSSGNAEYCNKYYFSMGGKLFYEAAGEDRNALDLPVDTEIEEFLDNRYEDATVFSYREYITLSGTEYEVLVYSSDKVHKLVFDSSKSLAGETVASGLQSPLQSDVETN